MHLLKTLCLHFLDLLEELRDNVLLLLNYISRMVNNGGANGRCRLLNRWHSGRNWLVLVEDILDAPNNLIDEIGLKLLALCFL